MVNGKLVNMRPIVGIIKDKDNQTLTIKLESGIIKYYKIKKGDTFNIYKKVNIYYDFTNNRINSIKKIINKDDIEALEEKFDKEEDSC